jgi:AraC-like DNA-binding protein
MKIDFNGVVLFHLLVIIQGFTAGVLLLFSHRQHRQNLWLGALVIAMTLQVVNSFFISSGIYQGYKWLYFFPLFYSWSYGAFFYFYAQSLNNQHFKFNRWHWLHLIPLSIQAFFYLFIFFHDLDFKAWFWINIHKPYTRFVDAYVSIALVFSYLYVCHESVNKIDKRLRYFIVALSIFYALAALDPLINHLYLPPRSPKFYLLEYILPIFTYWLSLMIYFKEKNQDRIKKQKAEINPDYLQKIIEIFEQKQLYLNPELTLLDVSQAVGLSINVISQTVNTGTGQSFNDFINQYRVLAIKAKFEKGDHLTHTLLAIAFDCGFNSKNTFNRAFKKSTGFSPKEYLDNEMTPKT